MKRKPPKETHHMAHNITKRADGTREFAYVGAPGWHGLGTKLEPGASHDEWAKAAGFEWEAVRRPLFYSPGTADAEHDEDAEEGSGEVAAYEDSYVLLRSDTQRPLSIVSGSYKRVQPREVLNFFADVAEHIGGFELDAAGTLHGGKKIWALARATSDGFALGDDRVNQHLLMATSFDFSISTIVTNVATRVVCENTVTAALREQGAAKYSVKHISNFNFEGVREAMKLDESWAAFAEAAEALASKKLESELQARALFQDLLYPKKEQEEKLTNRQEAKIDELVAIMRNSPGADLSSANGTLWGWLNGVTYYVDHAVKARSVEARSDRAWFGEGDKLKSRALELAYSTL